jgi:diguanylate cyclase (GGDEF)-like protein
MSLGSILIFGAIILGCGCAGLLLVRFDNPRLLGLGWLGAALGTGGTGALTLLVDPRRAPLISILLADLLVLSSFVLLNLAVMEVVKVTGVPAFPLLLLSLQAVFDLFMIFGRGSQQLRVTVVGVLIAAQTARTVLLLLRRAALAVRSPARFISVLLIGFIAWNLLRSVITAIGLLTNRIFVDQRLLARVQIFTDVLYLTVALGLAFGFFWMTTAGLTATVEDLANTDPLTGVLNRRAFSRSFQDEFNRCQRFSTSFALLMLDLDHFKQVNDRYGHTVGDEVLCTAVHNMKDSIRGIDVIGRWGGEEFVILLPQANADTAQIVAERIRANIHRPAPSSDPAKHILFTVSLGIAIGEPGDSVERILRRVDDGLYLAKSAGRNCIRSAPFDPLQTAQGRVNSPQLSGSAGLTEEKV